MRVCIHICILMKVRFLGYCSIKMLIDMVSYQNPHFLLYDARALEWGLGVKRVDARGRWVSLLANQGWRVPLWSSAGHTYVFSSSECPWFSSLTCDDWALLWQCFGLSSLAVWCARRCHQGPRSTSVQSVDGHSAQQSDQSQRHPGEISVREQVSAPSWRCASQVGRCTPAAVASEQCRCCFRFDKEITGVKSCG